MMLMRGFGDWRCHFFEQTKTQGIRLDLNGEMFCWLTAEVAPREFLLLADNSKTQGNRPTIG
jgi:hypothetical protein